MRTVSTHQNEFFPQSCYDLLGKFAIALSRLFTLNYIDALEQSHSSYFTNTGIGKYFFSQPLFEMSAGIFCILLQLLPLNDIQDSTCGCHSKRISSIGTEEFHISFSVAFGNLFCANNCCNWETVSHRFSHCQNIRDNAIIITGPIRFSQSGKSSLDLITNADDSFRSEFLVKLLIEVLWRNDLSSTALHILANESRSVFSNNILEVVDVVLYWIFWLSELPSVETGSVSNSDIIRLLIVFAPLAGANINTFARDSMIGAIETYDLVLLGMNLCHLHCQIVRFRTRVHESNYTKLLRNFLEELMCGGHQLII